MLDPNAKRPDGKFVYSSIKRRELMQQNEKIIAKRNAKALQELDAIIPLVNQLGAPGHAIIAKYQKYEPAFHRLHCIKVAIAAIKREVQDQTKYKEQPVDIETFVTGAEYLNMKIKPHMDETGDIYPEILEELKKACSRPYVEHVYTGSIGSAKSTSSLILFCYHLYILSCLRDPHKEYSLLKSDEIVMVFQSLNASHAKTVNYGRFKAMVSQCKYFQRNFMYDKSIDSEMRFPNRIIVRPISGSSTGAIGSNIISALLDEVNWMKVTEKSKKTAEGGSYDQAQENYSTMVRRRESRFMKKGKTAGILCLVSSKRYPGELTDIKIKEAETNPNIYIYDKRVWDISPPGRYTGDTFKLFTGDVTRRPRILEPHDVLHGDDEKLVMNVPIEYKRSFENDPLGSLRDIAGVSTMALQPYIMDVEAVDRMFDKEMESILDLDEVEFTTEEIHFIAENLKHPAEPRAVHIDLAMTTDSAGLVCGYVAGFTKMERDEGEYETLPVICLDFILRIVPPKNGEIPFHRIRALIHKLKTLGVNIQWVSADLFQAVDTLQLLARKGFKVGVQSMDKTVIPYDITKDAIMDGRVHAPVHETARMEIISLERDLKKNKIDHGNVYGKDCSDALTGVVYLLTTRREIWVKHKIPLVHIPSSIVSKTNKNSNSIDKRKPTQQAEEDDDE